MYKFNVHLSRFLFNLAFENMTIVQKLYSFQHVVGAANRAIALCYNSVYEYRMLSRFLFNQ